MTRFLMYEDVISAALNNPTCMSMEDRMEKPMFDDVRLTEEVHTYTCTRV